MNAQEISKMIEDEISVLRKANKLLERLGPHAPTENSVISRLVVPYLEDYEFFGLNGTSSKAKLWTVWDENKDSTEQKYVIVYDEKEKAFGIALKPSYTHVSQYKDSFIDCLSAL